MDHVTMEFDVPVTMRDGTVLRADITWPPGDGPFPVLVERTPYDKNVRASFAFDPIDAARAGFIVVRQDTRGSFASEGEWMPWAHERDDGYDTIAWAASLPKSNGRVGGFGGSYTGSTQWSSAMTRPPGLAAIAPIFTWSEPEDGLMFRGGAIELGLNSWWGLYTAATHMGNAYPPDEAPAKAMEAFGHFAAHAERVWELPAAAQPHFTGLGMPDIGVARALADPGTAGDARVRGNVDDVAIPSLNLAGWFDVFLQGSLDNYRAMRDRGIPARLIVGPWAHWSTTPGATQGETGEVNFGPGALAPGGVPIPKIQLDWFAHWLGDAPATADHESGVLLFVMGPNQWRAEPDWPLERAITTPLYLDADGALGWEAPDEDGLESRYEYDPADPAMTRGGNLVMGADHLAGAYDQRVTEARDDVLVFTGAPLEHDLEITGRVRATLFASTDGESTDWVVRLCEVDAVGTSRNIVDGITRVRTEPGRIDEVAVDLWSTSIVVRAGHRLRVHVTSSNFPRWDRNTNTGASETEATTLRIAQQRVVHDRRHPSRVELPVVPA